MSVTTFTAEQGHTALDAIAAHGLPYTGRYMIGEDVTADILADLDKVTVTPGQIVKASEGIGQEYNLLPPTSRAKFLARFRIINLAAMTREQREELVTADTLAAIAAELAPITL